MNTFGKMFDRLSSSYQNPDSRSSYIFLVIISRVFHMYNRVPSLLASARIETYFYPDHRALFSSLVSI